METTQPQYSQAEQDAALRASMGAPVPDRFQTHAAPETSNARAFGRSFTESALDAAALPVTLAAKGANALGWKNPLAKWSGRDAAESAEYLLRGKDPAEIREERNFENPYVQQAGALTGELAGGYAQGGLMARLKPEAGAVIAGLKKSEQAEQARTARMKAAAEFRQNHEHAAAVKDYMHTGYDQINRELRSGNPYPDTVAKAEKISKVLDDMAANGHVHEGTTYRGLELPTGTVENWKKAGAIHNRSFWSTSDEGNVAKAFSSSQPANDPEFSDKVILRMKQKTGVPLGGFEGEVLHKPGKNWLIKRATKTNGGTHILDVEEVPHLPPGITPAMSFSGPSTGHATGVEVSPMVGSDDDALSIIRKRAGSK